MVGKNKFQIKKIIDMINRQFSGFFKLISVWLVRARLINDHSQVYSSQGRSRETC